MKGFPGRRSLQLPIDGIGETLREEFLISRPVRWVRRLRRRPGLNVVGNLLSEIGLGEAGRAMIRACAAADVPVSLLDVPLEGRANERELAGRIQPYSDRRGTILICGLGVLGDRQSTEAGLQGAVNILYPFWEVSGIPEFYRRALRHHDELWAPSDYVARVLEENTGRRARVIHVPLRLPAVQPPPRSGATDLRFFTFLDVDSDVERKNAPAVVRAFRDAFPPSCRDVRLVVKLRGRHDGGLRQWLRGQAEEEGRIEVVDRLLSRAEMDRLLQDADVFVTLHRSEGFGFGAAEALASGRAVIATDHGGTTDFVTEATGYPVSCRMVPVGTSTVYAKMGVRSDSVWAEPDHDAAVARLRQIHADREEAERRTARGFALLQRQHGEAAVGARIRERLGQLGLIET